MNSELFHCAVTPKTPNWPFLINTDSLMATANNTLKSCTSPKTGNANILLEINNLQHRRGDSGVSR